MALFFRACPKCRTGTVESVEESDGALRLSCVNCGLSIETEQQVRALMGKMSHGFNPSADRPLVCVACGRGPRDPMHRDVKKLARKTAAGRRETRETR